MRLPRHRTTDTVVLHRHLPQVDSTPAIRMATEKPHRQVRFIYKNLSRLKLHRSRINNRKISFQVANYQQEAVPAPVAAGGGGGYPPANPYEDQSCNPSGMMGRGGYSTQGYGSLISLLS